MHCQTLQVLLTELHQHPKLGNLGIQSTFKIEALIWVSFWRALNSQPFSWMASSNIRHQSKNVEIWNTKRVSNSCIPVQCEESRIDRLTLFLVVTTPFACWFLWQTNYIEDFKWRRLHFQFGVTFRRVVLRERYILKGRIAFEGHWRPQSWTLHSTGARASSLTRSDITTTACGIRATTINYSPHCCLSGQGLTWGLRELT